MLVPIIRFVPRAVASARRSPRLALAALLAMVVALPPVAHAAPPEDAGAKLKRAEALMNEGNFREAFDLFEPVLTDPATDGPTVEKHLPTAVNALQRLGEVNRFDGFVEKVVTAQKDDWRAIAAVANQYQSVPHYGFIISGEFQRGPHRGGGNVANAAEHDRVRALQLYDQARPLAEVDDDKRDVGTFFMRFAQAILPAGEAWRLTALTDLSDLPDYEDGYGYGRDFVGAPCGPDGEPVFWTVPKSWDAAEDDGQRWRWALMNSSENFAGFAPANDLSVADFYWSLYGVQTMQQMRFGWNPWGIDEGDDDDSPLKQTYKLQTLTDGESLAKTACGIQRVELPDHANFVKIYQRVAETAESNYPERAMERLVDVYKNRRQYDRAAKTLGELIARFGPGPRESRKQELAQIVDPRGQFEPIDTLPAGEKPTLTYRFRNGERVKLTARPVKIQKLLADVRAYLKSSPERLDGSKIQVDGLGYKLIRDGGDEYLGEPAAEWTVDLDPRPNHFDRLTDIAAPITAPGAYMVTATIEGGNTANLLVWLADTAIVKKPLEEKNLYYVADAVTGQPVGGASVAFFGYKLERLGNGKYRVLTRDFRGGHRRRRTGRPRPAGHAHRIPVADHRRGEGGPVRPYGFRRHLVGPAVRPGVQRQQDLRDHRPTRLPARTDRPLQSMASPRPV